MSGFSVTPEWCQRARRSVEEGAMEQLQRQRAEVEMKAQFWAGYLACIEELEEHIHRAASASPAASQASSGPLGVVGSADSPKTPGEAT